MGNANLSIFIAPASVIGGAVIPTAGVDNAPGEVAPVRVHGGIAYDTTGIVFPTPAVAFRVDTGGGTVNGPV